MRVVVVMEEWEMACCGEPFAVGDEVVWSLVAADPDTPCSGPDEAGGMQGLRRFEEEHHGQTPDDVPHLRVAGRVEAIWGRRVEFVPVPGERASYVASGATPTYEPQVEVTRRGDGFDGYLIVLQVADDVEMPAFALSSETIAARAEAELIRERDRVRMSDPVGRVLEHAAGAATERYGPVAEVTRSPDRSAVTIVPRREGGAVMRWSRSSRDDDGIGVSVGEGSWRLAATTADAEAVIELLDAAAAGSVSEDIETQENGSRRPVTLVGTPSREWRAEGPVLPDGHGVVMLGADVAQRLQRGRVEYVAWDGAGGA